VIGIRAAGAINPNAATLDITRQVETIFAPDRRGFGQFVSLSFSGIESTGSRTRKSRRS
jgi:hypothetical protein